MSVGKLTGPKKAAILLLALGEDGAAEVMKNLEESEIQQVGYYMTRFTDVAPEELDIVLEEFYRNSVMQEEGVNINASPDFVKNALSKALGAEKAKELEGSLHSGQEEGGLDAIRYADPVMISNYLRSEHPQTIALVLSYIRNTDQSSIVLRNLPENSGGPRGRIPNTSRILRILLKPMENQHFGPFLRPPSGTTMTISETGSEAGSGLEDRLERPGRLSKSRGIEGSAYKTCSFLHF